MTERTLHEELDEKTGREFDRKLEHFMQIDSDLHYSFTNHISIGISVAISIVALVLLYILASISIAYGSALYELADSEVRNNQDSELFLLYGMLVLMALVVFMSAFCFRFLAKLRRAIIESSEDAFLYRKDKIGKNR